MHVDRIWSGELLSGFSGTEQTLEAMAALVRRDAADLRVRQIALDLVADCPGHDFACEIRALFEAARDGLTYRRDPVQRELVQDTLRSHHIFGVGDCDDKVVYLASLLGAIGHKSHFVVIGASPEKFSHVYLEVATRPGWLALDPTPEQAIVGWEARGLEKWVYEIFPNEETASPILLLGLAALVWWLLR